MFTIFRYLPSRAVLIGAFQSRVPNFLSQVAVKVTDMSTAKANYVLRNLEREARILSSVSHPCIVYIYESIQVSFWFPQQGNMNIFRLWWQEKSFDPAPEVFFRVENPKRSSFEEENVSGGYKSSPSSGWSRAILEKSEINFRLLWNPAGPVNDCFSSRELLTTIPNCPPIASSYDAAGNYAKCMKQTLITIHVLLLWFVLKGVSKKLHWPMALPVLNNWATKRAHRTKQS